MKDELKVTFINVGYGEAMLLRCPDSARPDGEFTLLIDGGSGEEAEYRDGSSGRIRLSDYLAAHPLGHLDLLVATHIHEDHICGLAGLLPLPAELWQTFPPDFWRELPEFPESAADTPSAGKFTRGINSYRTLCRRVTESGGRVCRVFAQSEPVCLCAGLTARILAPSQDRCGEVTEQCRGLAARIGGEDYLPALRRLDAALNNDSLILMLEYGKARILLPGDTNAAGFNGVSGDLHADLFKMGHHGQEDAVSPALAERIAPAHAVCCASSDRRYESACPAALELLERVGAKLWFSDCPPGYGLASHHALEFTVRPDGTVHGAYRLA